MDPMGLYVHVPFCAGKCGYCSFYSVPASAERLTGYLAALEIEMSRFARDPRLMERSFTTLYIGGGTPSVLPPAAVEELIGSAVNTFELDSGLEVTLEANPESFEAGHASLLGSLQGGRLSLGAQSFCASVLRALGRRHDPAVVGGAVGLARSAGVRDISLDLIYGSPGETLDCWKRSLERTVETGPDHLSCYCLSIEEGTPICDLVRARKLPAPDESLQSDMYWSARLALLAEGFEHYEISNFARPGFRSRHNMGYWRRAEYIGLGPSAHSFYDGVRWGNAPDVDEYCLRLRAGESPVRRREVLSNAQALEEAVMLALRTSDGLNLEALGEAFGARPVRSLLARAAALMDRGVIERCGPALRIVPSAYFVSDSIIAELLPAES